MKKDMIRIVAVFFLTIANAGAVSPSHDLDGYDSFAFDVGVSTPRCDVEPVSIDFYPWE